MESEKNIGKTQKKLDRPLHLCFHFSMETLSAFTPLFTAGIFFIGFQALLLGSIQAMLSPLKRDIARLETDIARLKAGQTKLEAGQARFDKRLDSLEHKLDQLLARKA